VRVYEIHGPSDWAALVARFPLDVSRSRRHDWYRATGLARRWLIPDYPVVAGSYDAIHLSVAGYLTTAGVAVPTGDGVAMLAGWDPDTTWWLADCLTQAGQPDDWVQDAEAALGWSRLAVPRP
jgi:hypothetical protein